MRLVVAAGGETDGNGDGDEANLPEFYETQQRLQRLLVLILTSLVYSC